MAKQLVVSSAHPKLRGSYVETGSCEGRPAFLRQGDDETWILFSARFGSSPGWYFASSPPQAGELRSFLRSSDAPSEPQWATWPGGVALEETKSSPVTSCKACKELQDWTHPTGLRCEACAPASAEAVGALRLLRGKTSSLLFEKTAAAFADGDPAARDLLRQISRAHASNSSELILLRQPQERLEIGSGPTSLLCDVISLESTTGRLQYCWHKDGQPIPRACLPRLVLSGGTADAEGIYTCRVSSATDSLLTSPCEVRLSAAARQQLSQRAEQRQRYESPLRRAAGALQLGDVPRAVQLLSEAIHAAIDDEAVRAEAFCQRSELRVRLAHWQEAFQDAVEALKLQPSLARAHAARGAAAEALGFLAEAVSSWEAAELLGGVPEAASRAEACRVKLQQFFMEQQAKRSSAGSTAGGDPEEKWRRNGWQGRYALRMARQVALLGAILVEARRASVAVPADSAKVCKKACRRRMHHLKVLGFASHELPSAETLRSAYRKLALAMHPDKPGGSITAFQELQNAYEAVLKAVSG
ncbi:unnamed protein product [Durusdinium trenchii]|uniref:Uncharacterized protein n=1 Tax=Durusdinium trenchii TaxID=1381693 RepID=A0ABP0JIV6_9DINO